MSDDADGFTWEGIIRAVTMAGRPDRVFELQLAYNKYFQILDAASRTLRDIRGRLSEKDWSGTGADAYRKHYDSLVMAIDTFYEKTSKVVELSGDTGGALARAIADIPLPDMGDGEHPATHTIQYSDAESGNQVQYHFFRTHRDRYDDGGFLKYMYDHNGITADTHGRPAGKVPNDPYGHKKKAIDDWYVRGTRQARAAFGTLLAAYSEQTYAIPTGTFGVAGAEDPFATGDGSGAGAHGGGDFGGAGYSGYGGSTGPSIGSPPPAAPDWHATSWRSDLDQANDARASGGSAGYSHRAEAPGSALAGGAASAAPGGGPGSGLGASGGAGAGSFGGVSGGYGAGIGGSDPATGSGAAVMPPLVPQRTGREASLLVEAGRPRRADRTCTAPCRTTAVPAVTRSATSGAAG
ncbi:hypothetical protein Athai_27410 [Actinocatenispora thailandica]|uniref:Uncharacterized protein n=1 Tax=Actinocatenispora thailandica TaxID=227318 RepID=A0A7R7HWT9_9ACTN|nr:hypothetical protein [Actinocatenispora thailandica]BCJ35238.1 hypothetical protein Athai_27410 [Actinocatenispora thailandica]